MTPFIVIEVENNTVSDNTVVGVQSLVPIVVDWDTIDGDGDAAQALIDEILECCPKSVPHEDVKGIVDRLQVIVDDSTEDEAEDDSCPDCGDSECFGECLEDEDFDDEDEDEEDPEVDDFLNNHGQGTDEDDEKKEEDYDGNEFNDGPATVLDPRD